MIHLIWKELKEVEDKKKITLPIKIIIIGVVLGLIIAGIGGIKQINANNTNKERKAAAQKAVDKAVKEANERLAEIEKEYNDNKTKYDAKANECDAIIVGSDGWFEKTNKCQREKSELEDQLSSLEIEDTSIKSKDYTVYYQKVEPMSYQIFYIIGASVTGLAVLGAFIIYLVKGKKSY